MILVINQPGSWLYLPGFFYETSVNAAFQEILGKFHKYAGQGAIFFKKGIFYTQTGFLKSKYIIVMDLRSV